MKYCINCGRPLREGEVCICTRQEDKSPQEEATLRTEAIPLTDEGLRTEGNSRSDMLHSADGQKRRCRRGSRLLPGLVFGGALFAACMAMLYFVFVYDGSHSVYGEDEPEYADAVQPEDYGLETWCHGHGELLLELMADAKGLEQRISESILGTADGAVWEPVMFTEVFPDPESGMAFVDACSFTADNLTARVYVMYTEQGELRVKIKVRPSTNDTNHRVYESDAQPMMIAMASPVLNAFCDVSVDEADEALGSINIHYIGQAASIPIGNAVFTLDEANWYSAVISFAESVEADIEEPVKPSYVSAWNFKRQYCEVFERAQLGDFEIEWYPFHQDWNVFGEYTYWYETVSVSGRALYIYAVDRDSDLYAVKLNVFDSEKTQMDETRDIRIAENPELMQEIELTYAALLGLEIDSDSISEGLFDEEFIREGDTLFLPNGVLLEYDGDCIVLY